MNSTANLDERQTTTNQHFVFLCCLMSVIYRTYYEPPLLKDNGHILYMPMTNEKVLVETTFEIDPQKQFDQVRLIRRNCGNDYN